MITVLIVIGLLGYLISRPSVLVIAHGQKQLDGIQFPPLLFYERLTIALQTRNISGLTLARVLRREGSIFHPRRECLRITFKSTIHDVCASPAGNGSYISWWQVEERGLIQELLRRSPTMEMILDSKSDYQRDLEKWFITILHISIDEAIADISAPHGFRAFRNP